MQIAKWLEDNLSKQQAIIKARSPFGGNAGAGGQAALAAISAIPGLDARVSDTRSGYAWNDDGKENVVCLFSSSLLLLPPPLFCFFFPLVPFICPFFFVCSCIEIVVCCSDEVEKIPLTVVASRLPFAYDDKAADSDEDEGDDAAAQVFFFAFFFLLFFLSF